MIAIAELSATLFAANGFRKDSSPAAARIEAIGRRVDSAWIRLP